MRRLLLSAAALMVLFAASPTYAQQSINFYGGGYLVGLGHWFDAGLGVGFYQHTVPSVYRSLVNDANGSEIEQDLKLRIVPFAATVRFLPLGHAPVQPYVGAGVGLLRWRYS